MVGCSHSSTLWFAALRLHLAQQADRAPVIRQAGSTRLFFVQVAMAAMMPAPGIHDDENDLMIDPDSGASISLSDHLAKHTDHPQRD